MKRLPTLVLISICAAFSAGGAAHAQPQPGAQAESRVRSDLMTFFYKAPEPGKLEGIVNQSANTPLKKKWQAYPPLAGFLAVVLPRYPDMFSRIVPAEIDPLMGDTLAAAARLSGDPKLSARIAERIKTVAPDTKLRSEFANLPPRLADLKVSSPTHLDILWGASFASGDPRYVRPIIAFVVATANRSEQIAVDVARTALAMSGGPKDVFDEVRARHSDQVTREIIYASSALWALGSNASRHDFVRQALAVEVSARSGTPAGRALGVFLPKSARSR